eukprot:m.189921 g.189921  ORF g.189921 m.189921 type:complete len:414 (+) comp18538_c0_seq5:231-1472(+)
MTRATIATVVAFCVHATIVSACNTQKQYDINSRTLPFHNGQNGMFGDNSSVGVPLVLLPQIAGDESPACLDGSPYGFYFRPSTTGSTKWTISIEGGGWCYDEAECLTRSKMNLGTSTVWSKTGGCYCMNVNEDGSLDDTCNCLYMPYGDGASFSGFRRDVWPVPGGGNLTFRGIKNFDATMDYAFAHGLTKATEFVLTGGSAGGLSTFLHADRIADRLRKEAPQCKDIIAAPVVGYFLDHGNYAHTNNTYTNWMKYIYHMQNLTFGSDGALLPACKAAFPDAPHYCFMSPHMQQFIQTPFFMFNSKYDAWQLQNELQTEWVTKPEQDAVLQYGEDFLKQFAPVPTEGKNGAMITSCICHGCPWSSLKLANKTSYEHYADWRYGRTKGPDATHVDPRLPNGGGAIADPACKTFP